MGALDGIFAKASNTDFEKYKFMQAKQSRDEAFDVFVNRLRMLAANCDFAYKQSDFSLRIIQGCHSKSSQVKALTKSFD
jgi:hypothetical protein